MNIQDVDYLDQIPMRHLAEHRQAFGARSKAGIRVIDGGWTWSIRRVKYSHIHHPG